MKKLELTFTTAGKRNYTMSLDNPKDDLTLETVKANAEQLMKVLENRSGVILTGFVKAEIVTESRESLS